MITIEDVVEYLEIRRFGYSVVALDVNFPLDSRLDAFERFVKLTDIVEFLKEDSKKVKMVKVTEEEKENK